MGNHIMISCRPTAPPGVRQQGPPRIDNLWAGSPSPEPYPPLALGLTRTRHRQYNPEAERNNSLPRVVHRPRVADDGGVSLA